MKPADPNRDHRPLVRDTYDRIAAEFNSARVSESDALLAPLMAALPAGAIVVDLGCGTGVPITRTLSQAHTVIGVDFSSGQIALARKQAPRAHLIQADMARCAFRPASLDAVVSFYAIFHLPLLEHAPLISRVNEWLKPGGYLMATLSPARQEGYTEEYFGAEMYWSNLSLSEYRALLLANGFEILDEGVVSHGYTDEGARPEHHPLVFARSAR
jgi:SAM-dependent methyltransferase